MQAIRSSIVGTILAGLVLFTSTLSAQELDKYGGTTAIKGKATGFFHIENLNDRNWLITPDGNAFFAVALSHVFSGESDVACENVYGGDIDAWLRVRSKKHARWASTVLSEVQPALSET